LRNLFPIHSDNEASVSGVLITELSDADWLQELCERLRPFVNQLSEALRSDGQQYVSSGMSAFRDLRLLRESLNDSVVIKNEDDRIVILNSDRSTWFRAEQYFTANLRQGMAESDRPEWEALLRGDALQGFSAEHERLIPLLQTYLEQFADASPARPRTTPPIRPDRRPAPSDASPESPRGLPPRAG
jgi:hypothetical protein